MPKRPRLPDPSSSSGTSDVQFRLHPGSQGPLIGLNVYIINIKLSSDVDEAAKLHRLADRLGANVNDGPIDAADVIVTRIGTLKRLARHLDVEKAHKKHIVKPEWLFECDATASCAPYAPFAAVRSLNETRADTAPTPDSSFSQAPAVSLTEPGSQDSTAPSKNKEISWKNTLAIHRISPLTCPNQALVAELAVIMKKRQMDGETTSASAYAQAISALKAYPTRIRHAEEIAQIPKCGPSIRQKVAEFLEDGSVVEADAIRSNEKFRITNEFTTIYGIGPVLANKLYHEGCRSFADLEQRYKDSGANAGIGGATFPMEEALRLREELALKIPRSEVEEIAHEISIRLDRIGKGFEYTVCGGYRRGKTFSNDVDIIISRPDSNEKDVDHVCQQLVGYLKQAGLITHLIHLSTFTSTHGLFASRGGANKSGFQHFDSLDKALTVFKMNDRPDRVHRRVDLIFAPWKIYWTAVVGWTGSTQFERDIRKWSKSHCGIKFDSTGMVTLNNTKPVYAHSEKEVFEILDLPWIDPTMRNADF